MKTWKTLVILTFITALVFTACPPDGNGNGTTPTHTHDWEWTLNAIEATCTTASKDTATCKTATCTDTNERNGSISALDHLWSNWTEKTAANCLNAQVEKRNCTRTNCTFPEETQNIGTPLGHDDGQWEIIKNATYFESGIKELQCTRCTFVLSSDIISIIPFGYVDFGTENIPVFMTAGVTEAQMTTAVGNIGDGYDLLTGLEQSRLVGKIREIKVIIYIGELNSAILVDGQYNVTLFHDAPATVMRNNLRNWGTAWNQ